MALPFYNLNEQEFTSLSNSSTKCLDHNTDLYNLLPNPDKTDENDPDQMFINVRSEYYSVDKVYKVIENSGSKHSGSKNTIIGCIYRHPKGNLDKFAEQLDELLQYLNQSKYQVILVADFNIDFFQIITHQSTER